MTMSEDEFLQQGEAKEPLRICCYGSSSNLTPEKYLDQAYAMGKLLAQRGHVCVNGAGAWGCMGSLNQGASDHDGHIVGVIHGMFQVDGAIWSDGKSSGHQNANNFKDTGSHAAFGTHKKRELLIANGNDLQERKKMLVEHADALVVLPGGPGTWDELMEMACAKNLGLCDIPIVCVNVDGYYEPIRQMFQLGQDQQMIKLRTENILTFVPTALDALKYMEQQLEGKSSKCPSIQRRKSDFMESQGRGSMMGDAFGFVKSVLGRPESGAGLDQSNNGTSSSVRLDTPEEEEVDTSEPGTSDADNSKNNNNNNATTNGLIKSPTKQPNMPTTLGVTALTFTLGLALGVGLSSRRR